MKLLDIFLEKFWGKKYSIAVATLLLSFPIIQSLPDENESWTRFYCTLAACILALLMYIVLVIYTNKLPRAKQQYIGVLFIINAADESKLKEIKANLVDGFKLVPYLGPTFSYGISGKAKGGVSWGGITLSSDEYDVYETFDDYNRLDIMIGGGVALDVMDMVRVQIGYNLGLLNRNNDSDGTAIKTSGVNFGVAYLF